MAETTAQLLLRRATELTGAPRDAAVSELVDLAGGDRTAIVSARDVLARRLHADAGDWGATGALALINRAVAGAGWADDFDWRSRWSMPRVIRMFRRP